MRAKRAKGNHKHDVEYTMIQYTVHGEVAEWSKAHAWKACKWGNLFRGFEPHPLRHELVFDVSYHFAELGNGTFVSGFGPIRLRGDGFAWFGSFLLKYDQLLTAFCSNNLRY